MKIRICRNILGLITISQTYDSLYISYQLRISFKHRRNFLLRPSTHKSFFPGIDPRKFYLFHSCVPLVYRSAWHMFDKRAPVTTNNRPIDTPETSFKRRLLSRRDANDSRNEMFRRNGNRKDRGDYDDSLPRRMAHPRSHNIHMLPFISISRLRESAFNLRNV